MCWNSDDGYFAELATDGTCYIYTGAEKSAGYAVTVPYSAVLTYGDGTHETNASSALSFSMEARQEVTVTGPALPPQATWEALYLARVSSPANSDYYLQGTPAAGDKRQVQWIRPELAR